MDELLNTWGFPELVERFNEQKVTPDLLPDLLTNKELLKELVNEIGVRIRITKKIELHCAPITSASTTGDSDLTVHTHNVDSIQMEEASDNMGPDSDVEGYLELAEEPESHPSFYIKNGIDLKKADKPPFTSSAKSKPLKNLLNSTNEGRMLIKTYKEGWFTRKDRQTLSNIIVSNELKHNPDARLRSEKLDTLADMIVDLFPNEQKVTKTGHGKLFSTYYNARRKFKNGGLLSKKKVGGDQEENDKAMNNTISDDTTNVNTECEEWLKTCKEPWSKVEEYWMKTFEMRMEFLKMCPGTLISYINTYPGLQGSNGFLLFDKDFEGLYPDSKLNLYTNWIKFSTALLHLAKSRDEKENKEYIRLLEDEGITKDEQVIYSLLLIPSLLPRVTVVKNKSGQWRPSKSEVQESYFVHLKSFPELHQVIEEKKKKLAQYRLTLQPFIIAVGGLKQCQFYLRIDEQMYLLENALAALDFCFKSFHALHARYPPESEQYWLIVQKAIYKINTEWDRSYGGVSDFLTDIGQFL